MCNRYSRLSRVRTARHKTSSVSSRRQTSLHKDSSLQGVTLPLALAVQVVRTRTVSVRRVGSLVALVLSPALADSVCHRTGHHLQVGSLLVRVSTSHRVLSHLTCPLPGCRTRTKPRTRTRTRISPLLGHRVLLQLVLRQVRMRRLQRNPRLLKPIVSPRRQSLSQTRSRRRKLLLLLPLASRLRHHRLSQSLMLPPHLHLHMVRQLRSRAEGPRLRHRELRQAASSQPFPLLVPM